MKKVLLFGAGALTGAVIVVVELMRERLIVNNNLDGTVTLHWRGSTANIEPPTNK